LPCSVCRGRTRSSPRSSPRSFAEYLGVPVTYKLTSFEELFGLDGEIPPGFDSDPTLVYTPDVFANTDIVASNLGILPWRLKLMDLVPFIPNSILVVGRKGTELNEARDLDGISVALPLGTSYELALSSIMETSGVRPRVVPISIDDDLLGAVASGTADAVLMDSLELFSSLPEYPALGAAFPITAVDYLAWGIEKGNSVLERLLLDFFEYSRASGQMAELFNRSLGVTLDEYYQLIDFGGSNEIYNYNFTVDELRFLDELRSRGILRFVTIESPETYSPQADGTIVGHDYHLADLVCRILGVDFGLTIVDNPIELFSRNGEFDPAVITNPAMVLRTGHLLGA
jgi:membrane-bound lytic murein transglycosylase MltF